MFLSNKLFDHNIYNGTIGVITKVFNRDNIEVMFACRPDICRATSWYSIDLLSFDLECMKIDRDIMKEYKRLNELNRKGIQKKNKVANTFLDFFIYYTSRHIYVIWSWMSENR